MFASVMVKSQKGEVFGVRRLDSKLGGAALSGCSAWESVNFRLLQKLI
jgi:hypothetical protein